MNCPICDRDLAPTVLLDADGGRPALQGYRCPEGHGAFLASDLYAEWRGDGPDGAQPAALDLDGDAVGDVKRAKLCPQDRRIMRRYRVAAEGGFWIDRCGVCGGAWFDGGEWPATVEAGLHEHLPSVFSDAWQRRVEEALAGQDRRARLAEATGAGDLDRVDAFRAWVWDHPQRHLLLARLNDRPVPAQASGEG